MLTNIFRNQSFIETRLRSTLKTFFGRYHHLTLSYLNMADYICMPWYCCHEYFVFLDTI